MAVDLRKSIGIGVIQLKNGCNSDGQPARDFYNSKDLNDYFSGLDEQAMKKFFSIEFSKMIDITNDLFSEYYVQNCGTSVKTALSLLIFIFIRYCPFGEDLRDGSMKNCNLIDRR